MFIMILLFCNMKYQSHTIQNNKTQNDIHVSSGYRITKYISQTWYASKKLPLIESIKQDMKLHSYIICIILQNNKIMINIHYPDDTWISFWVLLFWIVWLWYFGVLCVYVLRRAIWRNTLLLYRIINYSGLISNINIITGNNRNPTSCHFLNDRIKPQKVITTIIQQKWRNLNARCEMSEVNQLPYEVYRTHPVATD
jgi:hypothetical protein